MEVRLQTQHALLSRKLTAVWARSHLKHDLRPYVCTYDECAEPNTLYDSWEEWTRHEQWAHQQRTWRCLEHPQHEYVELAAYQDHVRTYHAASMVQLLSTELITSQESVSQVCDRPCPFCQREFERRNDLQQHIAGHLEMIALLSLPNLDDIKDVPEAGEANSNSANPHLAESNADDFDDTEPLVFLENERAEKNPVVTDAERELFKIKLKNESFSFESVHEVSVEARQAYSNVIVGEWLYHLPRELGKDPAIHSLDSEGEIRPPQVEAFPDQQGTGSSIHWLVGIFNQSQPLTALKSTAQASVSLGENTPGTIARLEETYVNLTELPFDNGDFVVRLYYRAIDGRSRFFCRPLQPASSRKDSSQPLALLNVSRGGPFLHFYRLGRPKKDSELWASLKFLHYESKFMSLLSIARLF